MGGDSLREPELAGQLLVVVGGGAGMQWTGWKLGERNRTSEVACVAVGVAEPPGLLPEATHVTPAGSFWVAEPTAV